MGPARAAGRHARRPPGGGLRLAPHPLGQWLELLLPTRCLGCGGAGVGDATIPVCPACRTRIRPAPGPWCARCGGPALPETGSCASCAEWPEVLFRARSVTGFEPPVPALVHAFKYQGWTSLAPWMGARMGRAAALEPGGDPPGIVVPVPTTPRRLRSRGFNPAALLAQGVARHLRIPMAEALRRPRESPRQVGLPPSGRAANVRGAFVPDGPLSGALNHQHVLVVDDVLTTGATGAEAARAAESCGARTVSLVTFARALPGDPGSV